MLFSFSVFSHQKRPTKNVPASNQQKDWHFPTTVTWKRLMWSSLLFHENEWRIACTLIYSCSSYCYMETILTMTTNTTILNKEYCLLKHLESCQGISPQFCSLGDSAVGGLPAKLVLYSRREYKHSRKRTAYRFLLREAKSKYFPPALTSSHSYFHIKEVVHTNQAATYYSKIHFNKHNMWEFGFKSTSFPCSTTQEPTFVVPSIKQEWKV